MHDQLAMSRRSFLQRAALAGALTGIPGVLAACGSSGGGSGSTAGAAKDSLHVLVGEAFWRDWNPWGHFSQVQFGIQRNVFDRLVEIRPDLSLRPGLATAWRQLDDRTWEFELRRGVTFHDGSPFTAEDVKASIELASGKVGRGFTITAIWGIPHAVEIVDEHTVRLRGDKPFGPLLQTLTLSDIVSHRDAADLDRLAARPNGTGSFKLVRDERKVKSFAAFDEHYERLALRDLTLEYIDDASTRLNALLSGQAEMIQRLRPDQVGLVEGRNGFRSAATTSLEVQHLWLVTNRPPFDDVHVRRALAWGIDREGVAGVVGGATRVATSHIGDGVLFHSAQPPYVFDPERARAELAQAAVSGPVRFELVASTGKYPNSKDAAELMAANLREAGFDVQLTVLEFAAFIAKTTSDDPGEAFFSGWGNISPDPDLAVALPFHSPGLVTPYDDGQVDKLIDTGRTEADESRRRDIYERLQARLWSELPTVPIIYSDVTTGLADSLQGYEPSPTFIDSFQPLSFAA
jgi:peptide/nickel transport system substrate-binding protein